VSLLLVGDAAPGCVVGDGRRPGSAPQGAAVTLVGWFSSLGWASWVSRQPVPRTAVYCLADSTWSDLVHQRW